MNVIIGLGDLGIAVARRLHMVGRPTTGVDLDAGRRELWTAQTGSAALGDIADVDWTGVRRIFVVVTGAAAARKVTAQLCDIVPAHEPVSIFVLTTMSPADAVDICSGDRAHRVIELPVTGGELGALAGTLVGISAGPITEPDRQFLRSTVLSELVEFDDYGQPSLAKLLNNTVGAYHIATLRIASELASTAGLPLHKFHSVLANGAGTSYAVRHVYDITGTMLQHDVEVADATVGGLPDIDPASVETNLTEIRRLLALSDQGDR